MSAYLLSFLIMFGTASIVKNDVAEPDDQDGAFTQVQKLTVSGNEGNYTFSVTLKSPDKGCNQYANWWEIITENEELIYRRILGHSHVNEQPFTRSGGSVKITAKDIVIIRGHMNTTGYGEGEIAMKGSVEAGFKSYLLAKDFANSVENDSPQPSGCAF